MKLFDWFNFFHTATDISKERLGICETSLMEPFSENSLQKIVKSR